MWLVKLLLLFAAVYLGVLVLLYFQQTRMLFPTQLATGSGVPLPPSATAFDVSATDGERLHGVHIAPATRGNEEQLLIIGFGGNAWNAADVAVYLHGLYPWADVVAFHYRGYRPSTGRPSAAALLADAPTVYDRAVERLDDPGQVVVVGFSIGAAVAAHLASQRAVAGLILVTPFDSLSALARDHFPWAPVSWFLRHRLVPEESIRNGTTPTAVIAAERDTIVPPRRTEALRRVIPDLVFDRTIANADHNDLYGRTEFQEAMVAALASVGSARRGRREVLPTN